MDAERFDRWTKLLGQRVRRRTALSGAAAGLAFAAGLGRQRVDATPLPASARYVMIRSYATSATVADVVAKLSDFAAQARVTQGVVAYRIVDAGPGTIMTILLGTTQHTTGLLAKAERAWIQANLADLLPQPPVVTGGPVALHAESGIGCICDPSSPGSCGADRLLCCPVSNGGGICADSRADCTAPASPPVAVVCSANPGDVCTSNDDCCIGTCSGGVCNCGQPDRPEVGCPCTTLDASACGGRPELCCPQEPGAVAAGVCISPMASCTAKGCTEDGFACPLVAPCGSGASCPAEGGGCCSGYCLDDGTCGSAPVSACVAQGGGCSTTSECCAGLTCFEAICDNPKGCADAGIACVTNDDCCASLTCFEAVCSNPKGCVEAGQTCTSGDDCCSGKCSDDGFCYCLDPSRPEIACPCDANDSTACGGRAELCCQGSCISPMATCS